jgi:hypothetical protein
MSGVLNLLQAFDNKGDGAQSAFQKGKQKGEVLSDLYFWDRRFITSLIVP